MGNLCSKCQIFDNCWIKNHDFNISQYLPLIWLLNYIRIPLNLDFILLYEGLNRHSLRNWLKTVPLHRIVCKSLSASMYLVYTTIQTLETRSKRRFQSPNRQISWSFKDTIYFFLNRSCLLQYVGENHMSNFFSVWKLWFF